MKFLIFMFITFMLIFTAVGKVLTRFAKVVSNFLFWLLKFLHISKYLFFFQFEPQILLFSVVHLKFFLNYKKFLEKYSSYVYSIFFINFENLLRKRGLENSTPKSYGSVSYCFTKIVI